MDEPLRAVLAEDNLLVRQGLCSLLALSGAVDVLAACSSLPELLEAVDLHQPDMVLADILNASGLVGRGDRGRRPAGGGQPFPISAWSVISQYADASYALAVLGDGSNGRAYTARTPSTTSNASGPSGAVVGALLRRRGDRRRPRPVEARLDAAPSTP